MLYLLDLEEGRVVNAGKPTHIERCKIAYGHNNQRRWFWILTYANNIPVITNYYPCKRYEFHMMTNV